MWWAHVPEGLSAQSLTFSATHIVWPQMSRQGILAGKGVILPEGGEGAGGGIFQDLLGLCWHPVRLCYQLQLGFRGYSRGILGCGWGERDLAVKYTSKMWIWFVLSVHGCYSFMVYIRIFFCSCHCEMCFSFQLNVSLSKSYFTVWFWCWCNYQVKKKGGKKRRSVIRLMMWLQETLFLFTI